MGVVRLFVALVLLTVLAFAILLVFQNRDRLFGAREASFIDGATYQAVFLAGGQVYFGRLEISGDVYVLRDVYYLNAPADASQSLGQLLKRGGELHGPTDPMVIPSRSVLFFENMRSDSQVVKAIGQIKSGNTQTLPPRTASPSPTR